MHKYLSGEKQLSPAVRQNVFPVLTAMIWGTAFVAQSVGADYLEPFTFNAARAVVGALTLLAFILFTRRFETDKAKEAHGSKKDILIGGILCGLIITIAMNIQQIGMEETAAGKAGFLASLYILVVPVVGIFFKKKIPLNVWIGVLIGTLGLYFLCVTESFTIQKSDTYVLVSAFMFSMHILVIDHFSAKVSGVYLSCVQFVVAGILSGILALVAETPTIADIVRAAGPVLYIGIVSCGIGYTLQIVSQKGSNPTMVSLLLSLESVFSVISGAIILGEQMSGREYFGCVLMFTAVILSQIPVKNILKRRKKGDKQLDIAKS